MFEKKVVSFVLFLWVVLVVREGSSSCPKKRTDQSKTRYSILFASFPSKDALQVVVAWMYIRGINWR